MESASASLLRSVTVWYGPTTEVLSTTTPPFSALLGVLAESLDLKSPPRPAPGQTGTGAVTVGAVRCARVSKKVPLASSTVASPCTGSTHEKSCGRPEY